VVKGDSMALTVEEEKKLDKFVEACSGIGGTVRYWEDNQEVVHCRVGDAIVSADVRRDTMNIIGRADVDFSLKGIRKVHRPQVVVGDEKMYIDTRDGLEITVGEDGSVGVYQF